MLRFILPIILAMCTASLSVAQPDPIRAGTGTNVVFSDLTGLPDGVLISGGTAAGAVFDGTSLPHSQQTASVLLCVTQAGDVCWSRNGAYAHQNVGSALRAFHVARTETGTLYVAEGFPFAEDVGMPAGGGVALSRYGADGEPQWTVPIGGAGQEALEDWLAFVRAIGTDADENVYFTGVFRDVLRIGETEVVGTERETFLGSLDPDGNLRWVRPTGGTPNFDHPRYAEDADDPFAVDEHGNTYIGGFYPEGKVLVVEGPNHLELDRDASLIVSFDADGWLRWLRTDLGGGLDIGSGATLVRLSALSDGSLVAAWQAGTNSVQVGDQTVDGGAFITLLDAEGEIRWVRRQAGGGTERITAVSANADGEILIAGSFGGETLDLGGTSYARSDAGTEDGFSALYSAGGELVWSMHASGPGVTRVTAAAFDDAGYLYLAGVFAGRLTAGTTTIEGDAGENAFLLQFDTTPPVSAEDQPALANRVLLAAPYPNPAAERLTVPLYLPQPAEITAEIYDVLGRRMRVLAEGYHPRGRHELRVDTGSLTPGVYFVRLQAGERSEVRKFVLRRD